jgi:hypothetical protein
MYVSILGMTRSHGESQGISREIDWLNAAGVSGGYARSGVPHA